MKKYFLTFGLLGIATISCFAQTTSTADRQSKFSIGVDVGRPMGSASDVYNFGIGGSLKYDALLSNDLFATLSAGYESLLVKNSLQTSVGKVNSGFIPLKAGLKYYFSEGFFGEGQLGAALPTSSGGSASFLYSPGVGYTFDGGLETGLRYEAWSKNGTIGQIALREAYGF